MVDDLRDFTVNRRNRIRFWMRRLCLALALLTLSARGAQFTATLDRETMLLGDVATLTLTFEGVQLNDTPALPNIPGLQIGYAGQSSSVNVLNGQISSTVSHNFMVKPAQAGDFIIPVLTVKAGGQTLTSAAIKFKVVRAATPAPGSAAEEQQLALLRVVLPKPAVFVGETIVVELQLLVRAGVQNVGNYEVPFQVDGANVGKSEQGQQRQVTVGNTRFTVVPLRAPLTALRAGTLSIGPLDGSVIVTLPSNRRDPFDPFGMFNTGVQQRVLLSAPAQTLTALPLPAEGRPGTFTGAIGQFQLAVTAGPTNVAVGDPITLRVQVEGQGALEPVALPEQPGWREFKTYPATSKLETTGEFGLAGTKTFEQVVIPQNTEIKELPAFEFSYFDPEKRAYQTVRQPALPIVVRPGATTVLPGVNLGTTTAAPAPPVQDIVHIKPRLAGHSSAARELVRQPLFLALQVLPLAAFIGALFWRRRADALARNPRRRRQLAVAEALRTGVAALHQHAAARDSDAFFATTMRLLQESLGERLDLPASGITEAAIDERLHARGASEATGAALHELFQLCNQARYAPMQSAHELEAVIPKLEAALAAVREEVQQ